MNDQLRLIPLTSWQKYHEWPTVKALRWLVFNKHRNGFDKVCLKAGGRVLIDENEFYRWVEAQSESSFRNTSRGLSR